MTRRRPSAPCRACQWPCCGWAITPKRPTSPARPSPSPTQSGDKYSASYNFFSLGVIALRAEDLATAADHFGEALQRSQAAQAPIGIAVAFDAHAELALALADADSAVRLASSAQRMRGEMGGAPSMTLAGLGAPLDSARQRMDPGDFERAAAAGAAMSTEAAIALALSVGEAARRRPATSSRTSLVSSAEGAK